MRPQAEAQAKHKAELMAQREQAALQASPSTYQWNTQATSPQDMQFSPSFDCQRASNGAERLICSNRELAAADVRLAQVYRELMGSGVDRDSRIDSELVLNALLMAFWRRNPVGPVIVHSDQGSQYSSHDWQAFLKVHGLIVDADQWLF